MAVVEMNDWEVDELRKERDEAVAALGFAHKVFASESDQFQAALATAETAQFNRDCAALCELCADGIGEMYRVTERDGSYLPQIHPRRHVHMRDEMGWTDCDAWEIRETEYQRRQAGNG